MGPLQRASLAVRDFAARFRGGSGVREVRGTVPILRGSIATETLPDGRTSIARHLAEGPTTVSGGRRHARAGSGGTTILNRKIRYEEFNSALENEYGLGQYARQGVYDKMRRTSPQIRRGLWLVKLPILAADPCVEPADVADGEEHAALVDYNFFELIAGRARIREALTMFEFGVSAFEATADVVDVPRSRFPGLSSGKGGRPKAGERVPAVLFTDFEPRPAKTIYGWSARKDKPTQVAELEQWIGGTDGDLAPRRPIVPGDWLLRFTFEQEAANFQGVSILRPLYKAWLLADELETIDAIRHERQNCGIPVITLPEGAPDSDIDKAQTILSYLASHEQGFLVLPFGWTFKWDVSGSGAGTDIAGRLDQLYRAIADGFLAGFMALGNGDTGSYALAETQADRHLDLITVAAEHVLHVLNHGSDGWSPVRRIVEWNYGQQDAYPRVVFNNLRSKDDWAQILPLLQQFVSTGVVPKSHALAAEILKRLHLPAHLLPPEDEFAPEPEPPTEIRGAAGEDATPEPSSDEPASSPAPVDQPEEVPA